MSKLIDWDAMKAQSLASQKDWGQDPDECESPESEGDVPLQAPSTKLADEASSIDTIKRPADTRVPDDFPSLSIDGIAPTTDARTKKSSESDKLNAPPKEELNLSVEAKQLKEAVQANPHFDDTQKQKFESNMSDFEKRAAEKGLSTNEIAHTYRHTSRLLNAADEMVIGPSDRALLAQQVIDQAAHPTSIDQGANNTCNVTTIEINLYSHNPSAMAKMISDVATNGEYRALDGTIVDLTGSDLTKDGEARRNSDGDRSHATRLANLTLVNLKYAAQSAREIRYEDNAKTDGTSDERLIDANTGEEFKPGAGSNPEMTIEDMLGVMRKVRGDSPLNEVLAYNEQGPGEMRIGGVTYVNNPTSLANRLEELKASNALPTIVRVDTNNGPWLHEKGNQPLMGGAHVVNVFGYESTQGVLIDNQWGEKNDRLSAQNAVGIEQVFTAMQTPEQYIAREERLALQSKFDGVVDVNRELNLAVYQLDHGKLDESAYAKAVTKTAADANSHQWKRDAGEPESPADVAQKAAVLDALCKVDSANQMKVLRVLTEAVALPPQQLEDAMKTAIFSAHLESEAPKPPSPEKRTEFERNLAKTLESLEPKMRARLQTYSAKYMATNVAPTK